MRRKTSKKAAEARRALEREKDTIHYLAFVPRDAELAGRLREFDERWFVELTANPKGNPQAIEDATRIFETNHKVNSWQDIALRRELKEIYYP